MSEHKSVETMTDEEIRKAAACPKCGLKAESMLHAFCQDDTCPVLRALGRSKMPGMLEPPVNPTKPLPYHCATCGVRIGMPEGLCGECGCEDDCAP